jgi:hypothetical protein
MAIEPRYAYHYAEIDPTDNMCVGIITTSVPDVDEQTDIYVAIVTYSDDYLEKYYDWDTGKWYYDEEMTQEWIPPEA